MELDSSIDTAVADSSFQSGALKQRALDIDSSVVLSSDDSADSEQILAMSSKAKKVLPSPRTTRSEATDQAGEEAVPLGPVRSSGLSCFLLIAPVVSLARKTRFLTARVCLPRTR